MKQKLNGGGITRLPSLPLGSRVLRSLAGNSGFENLRPATIDFDLRGLGFGLLSQDDLQHALATAGAHLPRINGAGKRERACKASVLPFDAMEVLLFLVLFDLALATDGEGVVLNADIDVFFVDARDFNLQN